MSSFITSHCVPSLSNLALCLCRKRPSVASHCVPSLADYSACLRRSLRPIASHPWPLFHEKPTMSQYVPTLELQNGCLNSKSPKIMSQPCPNIHDRNVANYILDLANSQAYLSTKQMKIVANSWPNNRRKPVRKAYCHSVYISSGIIVS